MTTNILKRLNAKLHLIWQMISLGADTTSKIKLSVLALWLPLLYRLKITPQTSSEVRIKKFNQVRKFFVQDNMDMLTLKELFIDEPYRWLQPTQAPQTILDLGANVGLSILYLDMKFPGVRIVGIEANPHVFKRLQKNTAQCPNVSLRNCAVSGKDGEISFFIHPMHLSSSILKRGADFEPVTVEALSLDSLLEKMQIAQPDVIKFDIEGAEFEVFSAFRQLKNIPSYIGELHLDLIPCTLNSFNALFSDFVTELHPLSTTRFIATYAKRN